MRLNIFKKLKVINEEEKMNELNVGDCFLYGNSIIGQKENKKDGDSITYYKVINKSERGVEYTPIYDYLKGE